MLLKISLPEQEFFIEETMEFLTLPAVDFVMEHSLFTISKWEEKHAVAFYGKQEKSNDDMIDYIRCMIISPEEFDDKNFMRMINTKQYLDKIMAYINNPATATTFRETKGGAPNRETPTSELIYYWMIANQIPVEFEHWHINRLMTLIRVCGVKNTPPKKRSMHDIMSDNAALNAQRRAKLGTKG